MKSSERELVNASKFVSLLLRHKPETIGLELDNSGWARIDDIESLTQNQSIKLNRSLIHQIVESCDKQRYSISECGEFVRANQGHSISVDINLEERIPPTFLYHGTASRFMDSILENGLLKRSRQHVHLSEKKSIAISVGSRHGKPVLLEVKAGEMVQEGIKFYQSKNGVWLVENVPPRYLSKIDK